MLLTTDTQRTIEYSVVDDYLETWVEAFLIDRKANGVAAGTLRLYRIKLMMFVDYCEAKAIKQICQVSPTFIRQFLLYLEETGHNPGGKHAIYRAIRAFFLWYEDEEGKTSYTWDGGDCALYYADDRSRPYERNVIDLLKYLAADPTCSGRSKLLKLLASFTHSIVMFRYSVSAPAYISGRWAGSLVLHELRQ